MLISLIIPTRERAEYLQYSLKTALAIQDDNIEIVVSDNVSTDNTAEILAQVNDPRLKHIRPNKRLSMRANFQFALDNSNGEYVIYFGDDDGILPGQFPILRRILEERRPDGLSWSMPTYGWPTKDLISKTGGIRFRPGNVFGDIEEFDLEARKAATEACNLRNFNYYPRVYHGAASREYLQKCTNGEGVYFCGSIPDIYFCYRACQTGGNFLYSHHPFSINGYSPASTGGSQGSLSSDDERSKPAKKFNAENQSDPLKDVIPNTVSVASVIFATLETISERFPEPKFNTDYRKWYGFVLNDVKRKSPDLYDEVFANLKAHAEKTGTEAAFNEPDIGPQGSGKTLADRWAQLKGNLSSRRVSAEIDGNNNILSAARMCDTILSDHYEAVLDGQMPRQKAWKLAQKATKNFKVTI